MKRFFGIFGNHSFSGICRVHNLEEITAEPPLLVIELVVRNGDG